MPIANSVLGAWATRPYRLGVLILVSGVRKTMTRDRTELGLDDPLAICERCGYDLAAADPGLPCPECGAPGGRER
ncbi:MAG: hypothetical protein AAFR38_11825 [Planctomycetota bacterium]